MQRERNTLSGRTARGRPGAFELLARAGQIFAGSDDLQTALDRVAGLLTENVADLCVVELSAQPRDDDADDADDEPSAGRVELERVAIRASSPEAERTAKGLRRTYFVASSGNERGPAKVLETGIAEMNAAPDKEWLRELSPDPGDADVLRVLDLRSVLLVPLRARSARLGVLILARSGESPRWSLPDLALAEELAARTALVIDNTNLYREAQEALRTKQEFLATLSHELRTPLNVILGWSHLLRSQPRNDPGLSRALETIERHARSEAQLVEDILDASRMTTGQLKLSLGPVHLDEVVEAAADALRPAAQARNIRIELDVPRPVARFLGDATRLQQVAWHLLSNAIKFSRAGDIVEVVLDANDEAALLVVRDHGTGIAPAFLPHVFEPFRQADGSATRRHGGLGIGLALVRRVVELHGGTIRADSEGVGRGATFTVHLPLSHPAARVTSRDASLPPPAKSPRR